jgi:peptide/nickel transport system permease protein
MTIVTMQGTAQVPDVGSGTTDAVRISGPPFLAPETADRAPGRGSPASAPDRRGSLLQHAVYVIGENPVSGVAFALFLLIVICAIFGPLAAPYDPLATDTAAAYQSPSAVHWFGTDQLGRDIMSRVITATRLDLAIAVFSVALVFLLGGVSGVMAGFFGGWTDRIVGRLADTIMAFPLFVLAMGIVAALGNTVTNIVVATAIVNFPLYARVARAEAHVRRHAGFVQAARLCGNGEMRIVLTQILPNVMPIMVVQMSLTMGYAILNAAGLSFIGLGVRPPTAEWGIMVAEGAADMVSGKWWIAFFPGAALMISVFCFNLLGDSLRDIVDPQRRT